MTPNVFRLLPSDEDDDPDDDVREEDEDEEVEQDEEDEEDEETWQVARAPAGGKLRRSLDFRGSTPYTGPALRPTCVPDRRSSMASYAPLNVAVRCPEMFSGLSHIGGHGYADRDNRTTPHRQRLRLYPR
jgi:hypothetical protein